MVSLSHSWLGPNLPRASLRWNIQRSIEFPTSTNSPYPRMAPGNRETNNNNKLCFPTQPGRFVTAGKSLCCPGLPESNFKAHIPIHLGHLFSANPCPISPLFSFSFQKIQNFYSVPVKMSNSLVSLCSFSVDEEGGHRVIDTWVDPELKGWDSSFESESISCSVVCDSVWPHGL